MPSGHTTKRTVTPYRRGLMKLLPLERRDVNHAERKQFGDMECYGWVSSEKGTYRLTSAGREALVVPGPNPAL